MKGEQLSLLDWRPARPPAVVTRFPLHREVSLVRETARILTLKQGAAADRYWQLTRRRLYARLQLQGSEDAEIVQQLRRFAGAVFQQMQLASQTQNPKGAA